jgi:hypothetical protein
MRVDRKLLPIVPLRRFHRIDNDLVCVVALITFLQLIAVKMMTSREISVFARQLRLSTGSAAGVCHELLRFGRRTQTFANKIGETQHLAN